MLEVRDLHAFYGKSHILHGVHLKVGDGEIVSLLGRNGVGRSTTMAAIVNRLDLRKGSFAAGAQPGSTRIDPLRASIADVLAEHPAAVKDFRKGKKGAFNFLIGQLMKKARGCADPGELNRLLTEVLTKEGE